MKSKPTNPTKFEESIAEVIRRVDTGWYLGNGGQEAAILAISTLCEERVREAIIRELKPLYQEAIEASERSERKELHSDVDGVLFMIENRIKELDK